MIPTPTLNLGLVGPVLTHAIRLSRAPQPGSDASHPLVDILNVLPRAIVPAVSHAAIMAMPWIDSDLVCKLGDVWLLDTLHLQLMRRPAYRPRCFNVQAVQWWIANGNRKEFGKHSVLAERASQTQHVAVLALLHANGFLLSVQSCGSPDFVLNRKVDLASCWIKHEDMPDFPSYLAPRALVSAMVTGQRAILDALLKLDRFKSRMSLELAAFACATGDVEFIEQCHLQFDGGATAKHKLCSVVAGRF